MPVDEWAPSRIRHDPVEKGRLLYSESVNVEEFHEMSPPQEPQVPAKRARDMEEYSPAKKKRFGIDLNKYLERPAISPNNNNRRKASSGNSKPRSASTTKQRVHVDLTKDVDMESVDGRVPESVDGGVALSTASVDGGVPLTPPQAAADISSPGSLRAAMQSRAEQTKLPDTPLQSRQDKGKGKATEMAPPARLPTPSPEKTQPGPDQPQDSELANAVHAHLCELGLDPMNPYEGLAKAFAALRKEMAEPMDLENWRIPRRFNTEGVQYPFSGKKFTQVPDGFLKHLSWQLSQGNLISGDWAPLWDAFEEFYPDMLPGSMLRKERAEMEAANQAAGPSQQRTAPTQSNAKKGAAKKGGGASRPPLEPHEQPWGDWLDPATMSLSVEDYTFPLHSPWPQKTLAKLEDREKEDIKRLYIEKKLRNIVGFKQWDWCREALKDAGIIY